MNRQLRFENEKETELFAQKLASVFSAHRDLIEKNGFNLRLTGNLAAGKTTLTRALLRALGVTGRVKSPTFELVATYEVLDGLTLNHFDFYRFEDPAEFDEAGFRDLYGAGNICVSEWSELAEPSLPSADLELILEVDGLARNVSLRAISDAGLLMAEEL